MRGVAHRIAGGIFVLNLAAMVPFWVVKGTKPSGHAVLWVLYGVLIASAVIWVLTFQLRGEGSRRAAEKRRSGPRAEQIVAASPSAPRQHSPFMRRALRRAADRQAARVEPAPEHGMDTIDRMNLIAEEQARQQAARIATEPRRATEAQLAAAIRAGRALPATVSPSSLRQSWDRETVVLCREAVGELEAARFTPGETVQARLDRLDELAAQAATRDLTPSASWEGYVDAMRAVRDNIAHLARTGQALRDEFFAGDGLSLDEARTRVDAWTQSMDEAFAPAPDLRAGLESPFPPGTGFRYTGLSDEVSNVLGRIDHRLPAIETIQSHLEAYVGALDGDED
jgi:hypothetical protein